MGPFKTEEALKVEILAIKLLTLLNPVEIHLLILLKVQNLVITLIYE